MLNQLFQGIGAAPRGNQDSPLMDTLAAMSLPDLQKYAQAHKNDAATVALISSIANIKKKAMASEQTQAVDPQQPKIGEQVIAGIAPQPTPQAASQQALPEDQGIAQLPTDNLKGMAGGGIVAFEAGGEVPRFNGQTGSVPMFNSLPAGSYGAPKAGAVENQPWAQRKMDELAAKVQAGTASPQEKAWVSMVGGDAMARVNARQQQEIYKNAPDQLGGENARMAAQAAAAPVAKTAPTPDAPPAPPAPPRPTAGAAAAQPVSPLASAAADAATGINTLLPAKEKIKDRKDFLAEREDISRPVYEKAEGMINKEKNRLSEGKEQDFYMALIEGGLAAAAGDSPNGIQNLAKGFSQGAKSYSSALKDFRKAAQENSKMELDIERAKAAEKRGDMDAYQKYEESAMNRNADINKLETQGRFQLANTNLSGQYSNESSRISAAGSLAAAGAGARAGADAQINLLERIGAAKEGSNLLTGLERKTQEDKIPRLYAEYTKLASDQMRGEEFMRKYPTFQTYLVGMGGGNKQGILDIPNGTKPNATVRAP